MDDHHKVRYRVLPCFDEEGLDKEESLLEIVYEDQQLKIPLFILKDLLREAEAELDNLQSEK